MIFIILSILIMDTLLLILFVDKRWLHGVVILFYALSFFVFLAIVWSIDRQLHSLFNDFWEAIHNFAAHSQYQEEKLLPLTDAHERLIANVKRFRVAIWFSEFLSLIAFLITIFLGFHQLILGDESLASFSTSLLGDIDSWLQLICFLIYLYYIWLPLLKLDGLQEIDGGSRYCNDNEEDDDDSIYDRFSRDSSFFGVVKSMANVRAGLLGRGSRGGMGRSMNNFSKNESRQSEMEM